MAGTLTISTLKNDTGVLATQNGMTGIAKAWAQFTATGGTVTINGSFNISSITRNSTGYFTANFTTSMPNTGYSVVSSGSAVPSAFIGWGTPFTSGGGSVPTVAPTTSAFAFSTMINTATLFDPTYGNFAVFSS